ncbi:hypothetical protein MMPV_005890 [Pyropia vietnamensis]
MVAKGVVPRARRGDPLHRRGAVGSGLVVVGCGTGGGGAGGGGWVVSRCGGGGGGGGGSLGRGGVVSGSGGTVAPPPPVARGAAAATAAAMAAAAAAAAAVSADADWSCGDSSVSSDSGGDGSGSSCNSSCSDIGGVGGGGRGGGGRCGRGGKGEPSPILPLPSGAGRRPRRSDHHDEVHMEVGGSWVSRPPPTVPSSSLHVARAAAPKTGGMVVGVHPHMCGETATADAAAAAAAAAAAGGWARRVGGELGTGRGGGHRLDVPDEEDEFGPGGEAAFVRVLSADLEKLCRLNYHSQPPPPPSAPHSLFYSLHPQAFPLPFYISRLVTHLPTPPSTYITALILLDRLQAAHPGTLAVTSLNVHRLLITALLIAAKTLHEPALPNALAAAVGGVGLSELRRLELAMLSRLRWAVFVRADEYFVYERALMSRVERGGGPTPTGSPVLSTEW